MNNDVVTQNGSPGEQFAEVNSFIFVLLRKWLYVTNTHGLLKISLVKINSAYYLDFKM